MQRRRTLLIADKQRLTMRVSDKIIQHSWHLHAAKFLRLIAVLLQQGLVLRDMREEARYFKYIRTDIPNIYDGIITVRNLLGISHA